MIVRNQMDPWDSDIVQMEPKWTLLVPFVHVSEFYNVKAVPRDRNVINWGSVAYNACQTGGP